MHIFSVWRNLVFTHCVNVVGCVQVELGFCSLFLMVLSRQRWDWHMETFLPLTSLCLLWFLQLDQQKLQVQRHQWERRLPFGKGFITTRSVWHCVSQLRCMSPPGHHCYHHRVCACCCPEVLTSTALYKAGVSNLFTLPILTVLAWLVFIF